MTNRCEHCGRPGKEVAMRRVLCEDCDRTYIAYPCSGCGVALLKARSEAQHLCPECQMKPRLREFSVEDLRQLDACIVGENRIEAIQLIRAKLNVSLHEAMDLLAAR